jgi:hypothetical protein
MSGFSQMAEAAVTAKLYVCAVMLCMVTHVSANIYRVSPRSTPQTLRPFRGRPYLHMCAPVNRTYCWIWVGDFAATCAGIVSSGSWRASESLCDVAEKAQP